MRSAIRAQKRGANNVPIAEQEKQGGQKMSRQIPHVSAVGLTYYASDEAEILQASNGEHRKGPSARPPDSPYWSRRIKTAKVVSCPHRKNAETIEKKGESLRFID